MYIRCSVCGEDTIPCSCVDRHRREQERVRMDEALMRLLDIEYSESVYLPDWIETSEQFIEWARGL